MRTLWDTQRSIFHVMPKNKISKELLAMSQILDDNPDLSDLVYKDIVGLKRSDTGRPGMTAEQVLRCAILKQYRHLDYEELAFHLQDSWAFRSFARLKPGQQPSDTTLQENIKAISVETWAGIHNLLIKYAESKDVEKGRKIRIDSTVVDTDIHHPTDSSLLEDGIRIITRYLIAGMELSPSPGYQFANHTGAAKKRTLTILNAKKQEIREKAYKQLLILAERVRQYALVAIDSLNKYEHEDINEKIYARIVAEKLEQAISIFNKVINQTKRRVINGEQVSASEKVVSFFECHTDIIKKGGRDTQYGHKLFLTGGSTGLILDCVIKRGNPADSETFLTLIDRQIDLYKKVPLQVAADGGFNSKDNLKQAKIKGIKDIMFSQKRGLSVLDMVKSHWVYKKLRNFRAGIEANISRLKRAFGLSCCNWSGWAGFNQYVWSALVSYNLLVLAGLRKPAQ